MLAEVTDVNNPGLQREMTHLVSIPELRMRLPSLHLELSLSSQVREHFSPEFVNRIDELTLFNRLSRKNMDGILEIRLKELAKLLEDNHNIRLDVDGDARTWLCNKGYDPAFGARPLNRAVQVIESASYALFVHTTEDRCGCPRAL